LQWQQVTPVFCDIDPATHNIDPGSVERAITSRTTGILGVHLWGRPCAIAELQEIAARHRLKLLFDAAHAFGCRYGDRSIGSFGDAEVFSFHATKFVNAGEGGAVVTNDDSLAQRMRLMKNFGFSGYDKVVYIGTNGKMNELSGALGLTNLESIEEFTSVNRANLEAYRSGLQGLAGVSVIEYDEATSPNYQYLVLEINAAELGLTRDELMSVLHAENVLARRYFYPGVHRMEPYCSMFPKAGASLPYTDGLVERILHLPTGTGVSLPDIATICSLIRSAVDQKSEIRKTYRGQ
jgi:dTDP-4-amino-4,6-dideoxygalactose transaminase